MAEKFNPFNKWLGLNPKIKNPHHFQLLGIDPRSTDEDQIKRLVEKNAQKHLAQLSKLPPGKFDDVVKKLKARIEEAQKILSDPALRQKYLVQLKSKAAKQKKQGTSTKPTNPAEKVAPASPTTAAPAIPPNNITPAPPVAPAPPTTPTAQPPSTGVTADQPSGTATPPVFTPVADTPSFTPEPPAQPQTPPVAPIGVTPVAAPANQPPAAIPMAMPVAGSQPMMAQAVPAQAAPVETAPAGIGDVAIKRTVTRRKRNKWVGPIVALFMIGVAGGGGYLLIQNFEPLKVALGMSEAKPVTPPAGTPESDGGNGNEEPAKPLKATDINDLEDMDVENAISTEDDNTINDPDAAAKLKDIIAQGDNSDGDSPATDDGSDMDAENNTTDEDDPNFKEPFTADRNKMAVKIEADRLDELRRACQRLNRSLFRRDKKVSQEQLESAKQILAVYDTDNTRVEDSQQHYVQLVDDAERMLESIEGFWGQVVKGTNAFKGGAEIEIGEQKLGFLEADETGFVVRNAGVNVRYEYFFTPPGLAVRMGENGQIDSIPNWSIQKAAFYAVNQTTGTDYLSRIEELLKVAKDAGFDCEFVERYARFDFENFAPIDKVAFPKESELDAGIQNFRTEQSYTDVRKLDPEDALTYAEVLLSESSSTPDEMLPKLEEARKFAIRAGDAYRAEDAIFEMAHYSDFDAGLMLAESYYEIARNKKLSPLQVRALMETAIPFVKSDTGKSIPKRAYQNLGKQLLKLANTGNMVDCVRRLQQIQ